MTARQFLSLALAAYVSTALAASRAEQEYFAAHDKYVAELAPQAPNSPIPSVEKKQYGDIRDTEASFLVDLEKRLRTIIGPSHVKGFDGSGHGVPRTLLRGDLGFDVLNGLEWDSKAGSGNLVVSTEALLDRFLTAHPQLPAMVADSLMKDDFYTFSTPADAAWSSFAVVPVATPGAEWRTVARLGARRQDYFEMVPDSLAISATGRGRVYLLEVKVTAKVHLIPACHKIWVAYQSRSKAALAKYYGSHLKDKDAFQESVDLTEIGDTASRKCFAEKAPREAFFADVIREAQVLVDRIDAM